MFPPRPCWTPVHGALVFLVAVIGGADLPDKPLRTRDANAMIQYSVQVSGAEKPGHLAEESTHPEFDGSSLPEERPAHTTLLTAEVEFQKLQDSFAALSRDSECAIKASRVLPRVSNMIEEMVLIRMELERTRETSPACQTATAARGVPRDTRHPSEDVALLSVRDMITVKDLGGTGSLLEDSKPDANLPTLPGQFHRWHAERLPEIFRGHWQALADLSETKDCSRPDQVDKDMERQSARFHSYSFNLKRGNDIPMEGIPFAQPDGGISGLPMDNSPVFSPPAMDGLDSISNSTSSHSKWDTIMKNGFKQMSKMMKPRDPPKARSWLLLALFIFISIVIITAMLLIAKPLMTQSEGAGVIGKLEGKKASGFIQVALVYWFPTTPESLGIPFILLFFGIIVTSITLNFWVTWILLHIWGLVDPDVAARVVRMKIFDNIVLRIICIVGSFFAPVLLFFFRRQISGRWKQWIYLSIKTYFLFEGQVLSILSSFVMRTLMNYIAALDADGFWHIVRTVNLVLLVIGVVDAFISGYIDSLLQLEWRRFLTEYFLSNYMGGHAYYKMNSNSGKDDGADNPDQRMQGDVDNFVVSLNTFVFSIIKAIMTLISSSIIVWTIMPTITMILLAYCICGSTISLFFIWKFVRLNYTIQKLEADYRYSMVHIRDNAEGIAFYGGENQGQAEVSDRFRELLGLKYLMIVWEYTFGAYQFFFVAVGDLLPVILLARMLFQGRIDFGAMGQVGTQFANVLGSLSFINTSAHLMANLGTSTNRLTGLLTMIDSLQGGEEVTFHTSTENRFKVEKLCVTTPDKRPLVQDLTLDFSNKGPARFLVVGRSGVGKSSLLRTLAGLWTQGSGHVTMPPKGECMFLPQKPYMPLGNLRKQLCYPSVGQPANDSDLRSMLEELGIGDLPDRFEEGFDTIVEWSRVLSLGEQQRVAAIRAMIHQPSMVVLDESTSALSVIDENLVYRRFADLGMSYISVGHRLTIVRFHDQVLELAQERGGYKCYSRAEYQQIIENDEKQSSSSQT